MITIQNPEFRVPSYMRLSIVERVEMEVRAKAEARAPVEILLRQAIDASQPFDCLQLWRRWAGMWLDYGLNSTRAARSAEKVCIYKLIQAHRSDKRDLRSAVGLALAATRSVIELEE